MGLYDNFLDTQVKLFHSPCNILNRKSIELNDVELEFYSAGGNLRCFKIGQKVPYATPFYCYGKNFIILNFSIFQTRDDVPQAIFIRNGKFYAKKNYDNVNKGDMNDITLIVDRYGNVLNISTPEDIVNCITEIWNSHKQYNLLHDKYLQEYGIKDLFSNEYREKILSKEISQEQLKSDCKKADKARENAASQTLDITRSKWFAPQDDDRAKMINDGYEFGFLYFQLKNENNHQWEKQKLIQLLKNRYAEKFEENLEAYIKWVKENQIDIKEKDIRETISTYNVHITKQLEDDYLSSKQYENATFIYHNTKNDQPL